MNANITKDGTLFIQADNGAESMALILWFNGMEITKRPDTPFPYALTVHTHTGENVEGLK